MLTLERPLRITPATCKAPNLTTEFTPVDLGRIGALVVEQYRTDLASRTKWEDRNAAGMDLAMQITPDKSFPWPNCANVAFPLVTIAALQFHARAYPAIVSGTDVVKCRLPFEATPEETAQADAVGRYMSWQLLEEDCSWEEGTDRALLNYSIVGCVFKKTYFSPSAGYNVSEVVFARDLVIDYFAKSVETAKTKTQVYPLYKNEVLGGIRSARPMYADVSQEPWFLAGGTVRHDQPANRDGTTPPVAKRTSSIPFTALEQHTWLDLDGDGFDEPYIIIVELHSSAVFRIVARWERPEDVTRNASNEVVSIRAMEYFTKYGFIPAPDGSIYDLGFGVLLGPLNESVSTAINQLLDAGTMSTGAGGFLGRGAKIRGGVYTFAPFEWKRVDSTGEDLAKSIFPLPVREPSAVLFNLLSLLIDFTSRISGATETMVGENPGQNTPAETSRSMVEQGMAVYSAIFKRTWRAMKEEFKKLYVLNGLYAPTRYREMFFGDPSRICPAADPNIVSNSERFSRASAIAARAATVPGYNPAVVEENFLRALRVDNWKQFYVGFDPASQPKDPRIQVAEMKLQERQMVLQAQQQQFVAELLEQRALNQAEMQLIQADIVLKLAQAAGEADNKEIVRMQMVLAAAKQRDEGLRARVDHLLKAMELESDPTRKPVDTGTVRRLAGEPGNGGVSPSPKPATVGTQEPMVAG